MKMIGRIALAFLSAGLAALTVGIAVARTPTPTATPGATPTPSQQQVWWARGDAWLDGQRYAGPLTARIGDVECGEREPVASSSPVGGGLYLVRVVSEEIKPGCGHEGALVTFFLGDRQPSQTGVWQAGSGQVMTLIAGHPFARFGGSLWTDRTLNDESVLPYIGDRACGNYDVSWIGGGPVYEIRVYSAEQEPGCGVEGAEVTFKLLDAQGNVIAVAKEKGVWHAWDGVADPQQLNLTMAPVGTQPPKVGNAGTGEETAVSRWQGLSALLLISGLGAIGAAAALRRRAWSRPSA